MNWLKKNWLFVFIAILALTGLGLMGAFFLEAYSWLRRN